MNLSEITRAARRDYLCACCGMTVNAGTQYVRAQVPGGGLRAKRPMHSKCYTAHLASIERKRS